MENLGTLPGFAQSEAAAINSYGEVVGHSSNLADVRAFLWTQSLGMENLGTLPGGNYSRALSINDRSETVGVSGSSTGLRAFVWTRNGGMQDLNSLIPAGSDFVLTEAVSVNNSGVILAVGRDDHSEHEGVHDHDLPKRVFLLVPVL
jgi:probable HAF family extracellular repeat protein